MAIADSNRRTTRSTTLMLGSLGLPALDNAGSLTQRFFLEGEWHEATGWRDAPRALLDTRAQHRDAQFESFDRIPHRHDFSLAVLAIAALAMVAAGASMAAPPLRKGTAILATRFTRLDAVPTTAVGVVPAPAAAEVRAVGARTVTASQNAAEAPAEAAPAQSTAALATVAVAPIVVPLPPKPKPAASAGARTTDGPRAKTSVIEVVTSPPPVAVAPVLGADRSSLDVPSSDAPLPPSPDEPGASVMAPAAAPAAPTVTTDSAGDEPGAAASSAPSPSATRDGPAGPSDGQPARSPNKPLHGSESSPAVPAGVQGAESPPAAEPAPSNQP
jgi:hypothetical protein